MQLAWLRVHRFEPAEEDKSILVQLVKSLWLNVPWIVGIQNQLQEAIKPILFYDKT